MTIHETVGEENIQRMRNRFGQIINSQAGAIILISETGIMDCYQGYCKECLLDIISKSINDYKKIAPHQVPDSCPPTAIQ